jgi:hypothetical protein
MVLTRISIAREREEEEEAKEVQVRHNTARAARIATPGARDMRTPRRRGLGL